MPRSRSRRGAAAAAAAAPGRDSAAGWTTLAVGIAVSLFLFWKNRQPMGFEEYYLLNTALVLWVPLVAVLLVLRREVGEWGMTAAGDLRGGLLLALLLFVLFSPVILIFSDAPAFQRYYVGQLSSSRALGFGGQIDAGRFLFHQAVFGFYMFGWEWYHRGFLFFGLQRVMPWVWAALVQAALFALLHYGKPTAEIASSFFGALLLAVIARRFGSFLPGFVLHWAISIAFDVAVLYHHLGRPGGGGAR